MNIQWSTTYWYTETGQKLQLEGECRMEAVNWGASRHLYWKRLEIESCALWFVQLNCCYDSTSYIFFLFSWASSKGKEYLGLDSLDLVKCNLSKTKLSQARTLYNLKNVLWSCLFLEIFRLILQRFRKKNLRTTNYGVWSHLSNNCCLLRIPVVISTLDTVAFTNSTC